MKECMESVQNKYYVTSKRKKGQFPVISGGSIKSNKISNL